MKTLIEQRQKLFREELRKRMIELDDMNSHMNNIHEPIKGDIYFDGIEIEKFIEAFHAETTRLIVKEFYKQYRSFNDGCGCCSSTDLGNEFLKEFSFLFILEESN